MQDFYHLTIPSTSFNRSCYGKQEQEQEYRWFICYLYSSGICLCCIDIFLILIQFKCSTTRKYLNSFFTKTKQNKKRDSRYLALTSNAFSTFFLDSAFGLLLLVVSFDASFDERRATTDSWLVDNDFLLLPTTADSWLLVNDDVFGFTTTTPAPPAPTVGEDVTRFGVGDDDSSESNEGIGGKSSLLGIDGASTSK